MNKTPLTKRLIEPFCNSKPVIRYPKHIGIADVILCESDNENVTKLVIHFDWDMEIRAQTQLVGPLVRQSEEPVLETFRRNHIMEFQNPMITRYSDILAIACDDGETFSITRLGEEKMFALQILHDYEATHH